MVRTYWHPVALAENVSDRPYAATLLDEQIVICRLGDRVEAFSDLCIHRGTPISLGRIEGEEIVCAYHGWTYNADGKCTRIPSIPPEHPIPKKACLTRYHAEERYGLIWVCMAEEPRASIPEIPEMEDPSYRIFFRQKRTWKCSAARAIENFVEDPLSEELLRGEFQGMDTIVVAGFKDDDGKVTRLNLRGEKRLEDPPVEIVAATSESGDATTGMSSGDEP